MELNRLQEKMYHKVCDRIDVGRDFKIVSNDVVINFQYSKYDLEWEGFVYDNTKNWKKSIENGWVDLKVFSDDRELKKYIRELITK